MTHVVTSTATHGMTDSVTRMAIPVTRLFGLDPAAPPPLPATPTRLGVTVLIPTHRPASATRSAAPPGDHAALSSDHATPHSTHAAPPGDRAATLDACLAALAADAGRAGFPVSVVVVADGLGPGDLDHLHQSLERTGLPHQVVPTGRAGAAVGSGWLTGEDSPNGHTLAGVAGARNVGLAALSRAPSMRNRYVLHLDDDTALAPGGLAALVEALEANPTAVGVCARMRRVTDLGAWLAAEPPVPRPVRTQVLPSALSGGAYDLLGMVAHGSLAVGRVVGQLLRMSAVEAVLGSGHQMFYEGFPAGSTEDMLAGAALTCLGDLLVAPDVPLGDQMRGDPAGTRVQQRNWGFDHAWLVGTLSDAGLLRPGVHVLSWDDWTGWTASHAEAEVTGFIVNPPELTALCHALSALTRDRATTRTLFATDPDRLAEGVQAMARTLAALPGLTGGAVAVPRPDLAPPVPRAYATLRDGLDGVLGRLAGNALGSRIGGLTESGLPRHFLYGLRQQTEP